MTEIVRSTRPHDCPSVCGVLIELSPNGSLKPDSCTDMFNVERRVGHAKGRRHGYRTRIGCPARRLLSRSDGLDRSVTDAMSARHV
ncbi:MAG: hypothetical protein AAF499_03760 [Pseudomonadota bacterium]